MQPVNITAYNELSAPGNIFSCLTGSLKRKDDREGAITIELYFIPINYKDCIHAHCLPSKIAVVLR